MPDIQETFGAMFIGVLMSMIIYGITTLQAYFYYANYPKGDHVAKALVASIWILDTSHIVLLSHTLYFYLIAGFGNASILLEGTWSLFTSIAVNVLVAFIVQCYFTQRIFTLTPARHKWWLSIIIGLSVAAHFLLGIEMVINLFIKKMFIHLAQLRFRTTLPFLIIAVASDVLISVALCLLLTNDRSDFVESHGTMNTVLVYAINRCILTFVVAVIELVIFVALPDSFFVFAFGFVIGRLYANSLLATLNARPVMRSASMGKETSTSFRLATHHVPTSLTDVPTREAATHHTHLDFVELEAVSTHLVNDTNLLSRDGLD